MTDHTTDLEHDDEFTVHPLAHRLHPGSWDTGGHCICSAALPPQSEWHDAGRDWAHIICPTCGFMYVDEDEFIAICEPDHDLYPDPEDEECAECRAVLAELATPAGAERAKAAHSAARLAGLAGGPGDTGG